ncbi:MAG: hypothetical protein ACI4V0_06640 [Lachnospiraceae bacterium]
MPFIMKEMNFAASMPERQFSDSMEGKGFSDSMEEKEFREAMKEREAFGSMKGREMKSGEEGKSPSSGITNILSTLGSFFSQIFVFATITALVEKWVNKSRNTKKTAPSPAPAEN